MKEYVKVPLYICGGFENSELQIMNIIVERKIQINLRKYFINRLQGESIDPEFRIKEVVTGKYIECLKEDVYPRNINKYNYFYPEMPRVAKKVLFVDYNELYFAEPVSKEKIDKYRKKFKKDKLFNAIREVSKFNEQKGNFIEISEKRYNQNLQDQKRKIKTRR